MFKASDYLDMKIQLQTFQQNKNAVSFRSEEANTQIYFAVYRDSYANGWEDALLSARGDGSSQEIC